MLEAVGLTKRFFGITALDGVSLSVKKGETLGIIGQNGAGKTTLFDILTGFQRADSGYILYKEEKFSRTFQSLRLFYSMTVRENLLVSAYANGLSPSLCDDLLRLSGLWERRNTLCDGLPYGQMRLLELVRAAATGAGLLFLDEPSAAMTPDEALALDRLIKSLKQKNGTTVVMIEHNMSLVRLCCDRVCAMAQGRIICTGSPEQVLSDREVREKVL